MIVSDHACMDASAGSSPFNPSGLAGHLDLGLVIEVVPGPAGGGLAVLFLVFIEQPIADCIEVVRDTACLVRVSAGLNGAWLFRTSLSLSAAPDDHLREG